jgi:protocatechuate 3,4-dioxygenase beta subunit
MSNKLLPNESRRQFIRRAPVVAVVLPSLCVLNSSCHAQTNQHQQTATSIIGGACEGCEGIYEGMPQQLSWQTEIATASELGERLEMSGIVYQADGKTPAPNVILYVYHTDATGHYTPAPSAAG